MKQHWEKLARKVDAMTLRERVMIFAAAVVVLVAFINLALLDPQYARQKRLSGLLIQDQAKLTAMNAELEARTRQQVIDPDAENRSRLRLLQQQVAQLNDSLHHLQKGLVSPDKMAGMLEGLLGKSGKLQMVSLRTLPTTGINEAGEQRAGRAKEPAPAPGTPASGNQAFTGGLSSGEILYKHGVELTIRGSYADITAYLGQLEAMPWQLFWGKAELKVEEYPSATMHLTLYTLSLEKQWLKL